MNADLIVSLLIMVVSLIFIFWAADLIVYGIGNYAKKLRLSDYITGLVVVAMAASMPEVIASMTALVAGKGDVMFGTILGTNMVHVALVTSMVAIIGKKVNVESTILSKALLPLWVVLMVPLVLIASDGELGRVDGVILLLMFALYLIWLWNQEKSLGFMRKRVMLRSLWRDGFIFLGSLVALLIASNSLVFGSITVAAIVGIPAYFLAITVIAIGGAFPDFAVALRSIKQGHQDIGVGDILGSILIEFLLFFGVVGVFHPVVVPLKEVIGAIMFLGVGITFLLWVIRQGTMTYKHGFILLALYAAFMVTEIIKLL